jgi:hypothetical protein
MNTALNTDIRKKAKKGIDCADDTTVKMILAMLEVQEKEVEKETEFDKEMQRRFDDYEQGKIIPLSFDELETRVRESYKKRVQSLK